MKSSMKLQFSEDELKFQELNRETYNKGQTELAYQQTIEFYGKNPQSLLAKFHYAVVSGDYSYDLGLPQEKRNELLSMAKKLIKEIFDSGESKRYPEEFHSSLCNEYFWFYELHEEQYNFGVENVKKGMTRGYYSQCVGASMMAKKSLLELGDLSKASHWALKSIEAFSARTS